MNTSSDIWFAFARTFSMLFIVLALLILGFYLIKKFSEARGIKGQKDFIKILSVHHLSPKEKLVLLDVLGQTLLIGVTPSQISKISSLDTQIDLDSENQETSINFADFLTKKLGSSFARDKKPKSDKKSN